MASLINLGYCERPLREEGVEMTPDYDVRTGRHFAYLGTSNQLHTDWLNNTILNREYRLGRQWQDNDETDAFMLDSANNAKGRVQWTMNYMYRLAQSFISNAAKMDLSYSCENISPNSVDRKESQREKIKYISRYGDQSSPSFKRYLQDKYPLGMDEQQTEQIFDLSYSDILAKNCTYLLDRVIPELKLNDHLQGVGADLCDSGALFVKPRIHFVKMDAERITPDRMIIDRRAKRNDLTDSEFIGCWEDYDATTIIERWQDITAIERAAILSHTSGISDASPINYTLSNPSTISTRLPVVFIYWKDVDSSKWGYVSDDFGSPMLKKIDFIYDGDDLVRYTEKDVISPDKLNPKQKEVLKGGKTVKLHLDIVRYCEFIPVEYCPIFYDNGVTRQLLQKDVILGSGVLEWQEPDLYNPRNCELPIKACTWIYANGEIITPFSLVRDPQNLINRYESIREQMLAHLPMGGLIYDSTMLGEQEGHTEVDLIKAQNYGEPFGLEANHTGLNNAVAYPHPNYQNVVGLFEIIDKVKFKMQDILGLNDAFLASTQSGEKLVGVSAMEIQQASSMQFPFFNAISSVFEQVYHVIVNPYRKALANYDHTLISMIGENNAIELNFARELNIEEVRVFLKRTMNKEQLIEKADQMIIPLMQMGLMPETASRLLFKSTPREVQQAWNLDIQITKIAQQQAAQDKQAQSEAAYPKMLEAGIAEQGQAEKDSSLPLAVQQQRGQDDSNKQTIKSATDLVKQKMQMENNKNNQPLPAPSMAEE